MRATASLQALREMKRRAERQAELAVAMPAEKEIIWYRPSTYYVAVSEWGYGVHRIPAVAIRLAQDEVPARSKPRQLLIYEGIGDEGTEIEPTGWDARDHAPTWPNGAKLRLAGLTTTHSLFKQSPRLIFTGDNPKETY